MIVKWASDYKAFKVIDGSEMPPKSWHLIENKDYLKPTDLVYLYLGFHQGRNHPPR
ncbi:MAG: hypothetical protein ACUVWK_03835 [Nitrososphaerales archaeon]